MLGEIFDEMFFRHLMINTNLLCEGVKLRICSSLFRVKLKLAMTTSKRRQLGHRAARALIWTEVICADWSRSFEHVPIHMSWWSKETYFLKTVNTYIYTYIWHIQIYQNNHSIYIYNSPIENKSIVSKPWNFFPSKIWKIMFLLPFPETHSSPVKICRAPKTNKKLVFQPSIFRCEPISVGSALLSPHLFRQTWKQRSCHMFKGKTYGQELTFARGCNATSFGMWQM